MGQRRSDIGATGLCEPDDVTRRQEAARVQGTSLVIQQPEPSKVANKGSAVVL